MRRLCFCSRRNGQATLSFVLLVGGIIMEIAIAASILTYFLGNTGYGERLSFRALSVANAGMQDARLKLSRNKEFGGGSLNYTVNLDSDSASVTIVRSYDAQGTYIYTVTSVGTALSRKRKLVATIVVDPVTGFLQPQSFVETSI